MEAILQMKDIVKRFDGLCANDGISFELRKGEILCILGENGAGKTTLMNTLYGLWPPDGGSICLQGKRVHFKSPRDAIRHRIGMVAQHFSLVPTITVSENITLGNIPTKRFSPFIDRRAAIERSQELARSCNFHLEMHRKVEELSVGEQQRVEILKALYHGAEILILDEPTAVLTDQESEELFRILRSMTEKGRSIIFITHKMREAMSCDRVVVLRAGKVLFTGETGGTSAEELTRAMFGESTGVSLARRSASQERTAVLEVEQLCVRDERGLLLLKDVTFTVAAGEIFGVAGVAGNGQRELSEAVTGLCRCCSGRIRLNREDITNHPPKRRREKAIVHIPEERHRNGALLDLPVYLNLILGREDRRPFSRNALLEYPPIYEFSERMREEYGIKMASIRTLAGHLSGGNLQKLILARELASRHLLIVAAQPTRGLDVKTTHFVRRKLLEAREEGKAVLLISYDLDEIFSLADRIAVLFKGEMTVTSPEECGRREVEGLMTGIGAGKGHDDA